jgi:hypothetical protein
VVHLIPCVLRELNVEAILAQAQNVHAVSAKRLRHFHAQIGRPTSADVQREHGNRHRVLPGFGNPPHPTFPQSRMAMLMRRMSTDIMRE